MSTESALTIVLTATVCIVCMVVLLAWKKLQNKRPMEYRRETPLISDANVKERRQFLAKDRLNLEVEIEIGKVDSLFQGSITFFLKKALADSDLPHFYLDCSTSKRLESIVVNSIEVPTVYHTGGKLYFPPSTLKAGKNEVRFKARSKLEQTSINTEVLFNQQSIQSWSRLLPCIDHPSFEYQVSLSITLPDTNRLALCSLGKALVRQEGKRPLIISNSKVTRLFSLGVAILEGCSELNSHVEQYDSQTISWHLNTKLKTEVLAFLGSIRPTLNKCLQIYRQCFPYEHEQPLSIIITDIERSSSWSSIALLSSQQLLAEDGSIEAIRLISKLLVKSLDRKFAVDSYNNYLTYEWMCELFAQHVLELAAEDPSSCINPERLLRWRLEQNLKIQLTFDPAQLEVLFSSQSTVDFIIQYPVYLLNNFRTQTGACIGDSVKISAVMEEFLKGKNISLLQVSSEPLVLIRCSSNHVYIRFTDDQKKDEVTLYSVKPRTTRVIRHSIRTKPKVHANYFKTSINLEAGEILLSLERTVVINQPTANQYPVFSSEESARLWALVETVALESNWVAKSLGAVETQDRLLQIIKTYRDIPTTTLIALVSKLTVFGELIEDSNTENRYVALLEEISSRSSGQADLTSIVDEMKKTSNKNPGLTEKAIEYLISSHGANLSVGLANLIPLIVNPTTIIELTGKLTELGVDKSITLLIESLHNLRSTSRVEVFDVIQCDSSDSEQRAGLSEILTSPKPNHGCHDKSISWEIFAEDNTKEEKTGLKLSKINSKGAPDSPPGSQQNLGSDSDKIENILNKLSEYCDSNVDVQYISGNNSLKNGKLVKKASRFSDNGANSQRSILHPNSFNNISLMSNNTKESLRDETQSQKQASFDLSCPVVRLDLSAQVSPIKHSSKSKIKSGKVTDKAKQKEVAPKEARSYLQPPPQEMKEKQRKIEGKYGRHRDKKIVEEECEYTPKHKEIADKLEMKFALKDPANVNLQLRQWELELTRELDYFVESDLIGVKLQDYEHTLSKDEEQLLLDIKEKHYSNFISGYLLMRARKKSDLESIYCLLRDSGIVNSISFPEEKLRTIFDFVKSSRSLNCRFKRSSFVDLLVKVAIERYHSLGEVDTYEQVTISLTTRLSARCGENFRSILKMTLNTL